MTQEPQNLQRRTLAAIVFSDIADFSVLMGGDEERTLALVKRDLELLRRTCAKFHGQVLKSTGDGLLMYFDSAVQAVGCALEIQQALADAAKTRPPAQVLRHRLGVHLGDVFLSEGDVMGDGVNIAARLQTEAEPGGICISQTVYDVVKNRLDFRATSLGSRELKNIRDAVHVYQIVLDAQAVGQPRPVARKRHPLGVWLYVIMGTLAAVVVLGVALTAYVLTDRGRGGDAARTSPERRGPGSRPDLAPPNLSGSLPARRPGGAGQRSFQEFLRARDGREQERLRSLRAMLPTLLQGTSESKPLVLPGLRKTEVWYEGGIVLRDERGTRRVVLDELSAGLALRLMDTALSNLSSEGTVEQRRLLQSLGEELRQAEE